ncbi:MAG: hypothetical protein GYB64_06510 [Chloroflexi bacterium]|nr:hypothetical protein [Chloroflexota bacterium]
MTDVRPLRWHDLPLAYRLAGHGVSFDTQLRITIGDDPLRQALLTSLGRTHIYVLRYDEEGGLGQLHYPAQQSVARLAYIAPMLESAEDEGLWLSLLDGLAVAAGQRGAVNIIAEVDDDSPLMDILRRANFGVYARQELWRRTRHANGEPTGVLRPAHEADEIAMRVLYSELTSGLMRQVEPLSTVADAIYVMEGPQGRNHIIGMVIEHRGVRRNMLEMYLSPAAGERADAFVREALALSANPDRPVYCRIRCKVAALGMSLSEHGFEPMASQAVMVRHTAARIKHHAFEKLPVIDSIMPAANRITDVGD